MSEIDGRYEEQLALAWADFELLVRRFQTLSAPAWESRRGAVLAMLRNLVEINAVLEDRALPQLPQLASFALADAFSVICADVLTALARKPDSTMLSRVADELGRARPATR